MGLQIIPSTTDKHQNNNDHQPLDGSRVIIHNTDEFPFRTGHHKQKHMDETINIMYTPILNILDETLKTWKPEKRNCYLDQEKNLKYFKIYTKANCEHECLSAAMLQTCGCIPFYMISELTAGTA